MSILTLELKNESDLDLFVTFAKRLNITVLDITKTRNEEIHNPVYWLEELALKGGTKSIENPTQWQKETRTDKVLFNRE